MADAPLISREEAELARLRARLARLEGAVRAYLDATAAQREVDRYRMNDPVPEDAEVSWAAGERTEAARLTLAGLLPREDKP